MHMRITHPRLQILMTATPTHAMPGFSRSFRGYPPLRYAMFHALLFRIISGL